MLDLTSIGGACLAALLMTTACSTIYDSEVFLTADATAPIVPSELVVVSAQPLILFEGQGANVAARAVPIVVHGKNIAPGARILITGAGVDVEVEAVASADGTMAAAAVRIPVDASLEDGMTAALAISVQQGEGTADGPEVSPQVQGLEEITIPAGDFQVSEISPRYSQIRIDAAVNLVGDTPARFVATDSIALIGELRADGRVDGKRSAGGFLGGLAGQSAASAGGGQRGENTSGGGGGGNLMVGMPGQGNDGGPGGDMIEATMLSPLSAVVGHGGGGGGVPALGDGGPGGAGGGAIELSAGGILTLGTNAVLSANGDVGTASGACLNGGSGGGGSGGAVLLRSETQIVIEGDATLAVAGGPGGSRAGCQGGNGSVGRIRADAPDLQGSPGTFVRGPSWLVDSIPPIVTESTTSATLAGDVGATYFVQVGDAEPKMITQGAATQSVSFTLEPGLNQVCALVSAAGTLGQPESLNCISIAYISQ